MKQPKILVVEDERVVAADIEDSLRKLGYAVVGAASSGVTAIRRAVETEPDLVLMDIKLKGKMDGIDAAGEFHDRLGIPVVFLTAYADHDILKRAKSTSPSGYVLKPFDTRALRTAVEIALDRHPKQQRLEQSERRLVTALRGLADGVVLTDAAGRITFMNRMAERLTGWKQPDAVGRRAGDVIVILRSPNGSLQSNPLQRVLSEGLSLSIGDESVLVSKHGLKTWIEGTATPLRDEDGAVVGVAAVFRPADAATRADLPDQTAEGSRLETLGRIGSRVAGELAEALDTLASALAGITSAGGVSDPAAAGLGKLSALVSSTRKLVQPFLQLGQQGGTRPEVVRLKDMLEDSSKLIHCAAGQSVSAEIRATETAGSVNVDPRRLTQVILDIVTHCGLRMPFGGTLTIETDQVELLGEYARANTCLKPGVYAILAISQAGDVLIPPAADALTDMPSATEIIRGLGGDIVLRAEPGRVTTYELYLPAVE